MNKICAENKCTGCCTCYNICPKQCITMRENKEGYIMPEIDEEKCINCSLCKNRCPGNNESDFKAPKEVYAVWNLDGKDRKSSSSGGAATVFERNIIKQNGVVFASKFNEKLELINTAVTSHEGIEELKGSKYVQSYIGDSYKKVKENLEKGKKVLFIGTPCQVDGLNFLLKRKYENLVTVDFVCHGVPPIKYLKDHLAYLKKNIKNDITCVKFRDEKGFRMSAYDGDKLVYLKDNVNDMYYLGFLKGLFNRDSCYQCKYARKDRVSDLTVGDFWRLSDLNLRQRGVNFASLVMINTIKGSEFFEECRECLFSAKRTIEEVVNSHDQLRFPTVVNKKTAKFRANYVYDGFEKAVRKCLLIESIIMKIKLKIKSGLSIFIKKYG